jgi:hypothetical protein
MKRAFMPAAVLALALAGCGGANSHAGSSAPGSSSTPAASAARAPSRSVAAPSRPDARRRAAASPHAPAHERKSATAAATAPVSPQAAVAAPRVPPSFATHADAICSSYRHSVSTLPRATSLTDQEKVFPTLLREVHGALSKLSALSPPAGDVGAFAEYTHLTSAAVDDFVKAQTKSRSTKEAVGVAQMQQNLAAYRAVTRAATAAGRVARHLGMHVCGSSGSDWL